MAAPINNCVLIIHMILSASQLNVHTCVVDVRVCGGCTISEIHPKFQILFFLIETAEKAQKLTLTVLNRTNGSLTKVGR